MTFLHEPAFLVEMNQWWIVADIDANNFLHGLPQAERHSAA
jgi:hypothetical protein